MQHAHVGMHAGDQHRVDAALAVEGQELEAVIADGVALAIDPHPCVLAPPAAGALGSRIAGGVGRVGAVDRQRRIGMRAFVRGGYRPCLEYPHPRGMAGVERHGRGGRVHHQHVAVAGRADGAVDARYEGLQPFLGAATPMAVPHVAQQERRACRAQIDRPLDDAPVAIAALVERQFAPARGNAHRTVVQAPANSIRRLVWSVSHRYSRSLQAPCGGRTSQSREDSASCDVGATGDGSGVAATLLLLP